MNSANDRSLLAKRFLTCLPDDLKPFETSEETPILRIPAKDSKVGDLTVLDDNDELTVVVGKGDHRHFSMDYEDEPTDVERQREVVEQAIRWISDILAERIRFRNQYSRRRLIAGGDWNVNHSSGGFFLSQTDEYREYTWSGEKVRKKLDRNA